MITEMKNITSLAKSRHREWRRKKKNHLKKQLSPYKSIPSEDFDILKELICLPQLLQNCMI